MMPRHIKSKIYLDYAATTPVDRVVLKKMLPYFSLNFGNPNSLHSFGMKAMAAVDNARAAIADALNADFRQIIFTSSATEANNLALRGAVKAARNFIKEPHIIVSSLEHESVLATARDLEKEGTKVSYLPVSEKGIVSLDSLKQALNKNTILVSVMFVNNIIGVIEPVREITKIIREFRGSRNETSQFPLFHTDAVQAFQYLNCDAESLDADFITISSHKIYGPKGAAALFIKNPETVLPVLSGGKQEFNKRSGTENVPAIVGFAEAVRLANIERDKQSKKIGELKHYFLKKITDISPKISQIPRSAAGNEGLFVPHIIAIKIPSIKTNSLVNLLDTQKIAVSAGAACSSRSAEAPEIFREIGLSPEESEGIVRFSFGKYTSKPDIDTAAKRIKNTVI